MPARFVLVTALLLLTCGFVIAQPAIAPPPHPALDELVKEYLRLELPLPPPDAQLVRIRRKHVDRDHPDGPQVSFSYILGFRLPPSAPGKDSRYFVGHGRLGPEWFDSSTVERAEPTLDALHRVSMGDEKLLCFAIHCKIRGWIDLANAAYTQSRHQYAEIAEMNKQPIPSLIVELRDSSLGYWASRIHEPGYDRKAILKKLKEKYAEEPSLLSPQDELLLRQLELTVAPRKSTPGTIEALIDDLTEYWVDTYGLSDELTWKKWKEKGEEPYWKLAELGFDAVPTLIDHLTDDRLTRTQSEGFNNFWPYTLTVGHLCSRLLSDLSARKLWNWELRGDRIDPKVASEWFGEARKIGEEKWLVDHAVPKGELKSIVNQRGRPEAHLFRVIGAKHPSKIPELYRAVVRKPQSSYGDYIEEILASKLTREQKIALFEEGVRHADFGHRIAVMDGLASLDQKLLRKHLLAALSEIVDKKGAGEISESVDGLAHLVEQFGDGECWEALLRAARAADYDSRWSTLFVISLDLDPDDFDPCRRHRIQFFSAFLDDSTTKPPVKGDDEFHEEIRDYAATRLAAQFRFPVERYGPWPWSIPHNDTLGPLSRLLLRESVRQLSMRELSRTTKGNTRR